MRKLRIFRLKGIVLHSLADFLRRAADRIANQIDASNSLSKSPNNKVDLDADDSSDRVRRDEIYNDNSSDSPPAHWIELVRLRAPGLLQSTDETTPYSPRDSFPENQKRATNQQPTSNRATHQQPTSNTRVEPEQSGNSSENDKELQNELSAQRDPTTEPAASYVTATSHDTVQKNKVCQSIGSDDDGLSRPEADSPTNHRTRNFISNPNCSIAQHSPKIEEEKTLKNEQESNASDSPDPGAGVARVEHSSVFIGSQSQEKPLHHTDPQTVLDSPQDTVTKSKSDRVSHPMPLNNGVNEPSKPMEESSDRGDFLDLDPALIVGVSGVKKSKIDRDVTDSELTLTGSVKSRKRGLAPSLRTKPKPIVTIEDPASANLKAKKRLDNRQKIHESSINSRPLLKNAPNFRMNNQNQPDRFMWPDLPDDPLFHNKQMTGRWPDLPKDAWDELEILSLEERALSLYDRDQGERNHMKRDSSWNV